jgi:serine/threonine protein kinase
MSDPAPTPENLHDSVDQRCVARLSEEFERAWSAGQRPNLRRHLAGLPQATREALFRKLLRMEIDFRRRAEEIPTADEYRAGFPEHEATVEDVFASIRRGLEETRALAHAGEDTTRDEPEELPETGDRYQIVGKVGRGAFATVYLAHDVELDRRVALKVPHHDREEESEAPTAVAGTTRSSFEQLKTEARKVARLDHAGIVPVYDVGCTCDGRWFLVSKLVEGTSLDVRLRQGKLPPAKAATIVADAAEALHAAHIEGLVHRDVKPANIMLTPAGRALVTDFGLALHEDEQRSRTAEISGSPCFMAPEQTRGETSRLDGRTDIWALGVVLYRALTGRLPFVGDTWEGLADEIRTRQPKPPRMIDDAIPAELERIALKCLAKNVAERYTTAADLARDLRNWETPSSVQPAAAGRTFNISLRALGIGVSITLAFSLAAVMLGLPFLASDPSPTAMHSPASQRNEDAVDRAAVNAAERQMKAEAASNPEPRPALPLAAIPKVDEETGLEPPPQPIQPEFRGSRTTRGGDASLPSVGLTTSEFRGSREEDSNQIERDPNSAAVEPAFLAPETVKETETANGAETAARLLQLGLEKDIDSVDRFALLQRAYEQAVATDDYLQARQALLAFSDSSRDTGKQYYGQQYNGQQDAMRRLTELVDRSLAADGMLPAPWRLLAEEAAALADQAHAANQTGKSLAFVRLAVEAAEKARDAQLLERLRQQQSDIEAPAAPLGDK